MPGGFWRQTYSTPGNTAPACILEDEALFEPGAGIWMEPDQQKELELLLDNKAGRNMCETQVSHLGISWYSSCPVVT